jgi:hypothetical protein
MKMRLTSSKEVGRMSEGRVDFGISILCGSFLMVSIRTIERQEVRCHYDYLHYERSLHVVLIVGIVWVRRPFPSHSLPLSFCIPQILS